MATPICRSPNKLHRHRAKPYAFRPQLVIMLKEPRAGQVKTRLASGIGVVAATALYRTMALSVVARLGRDARWQTVLAVSPSRAVNSRMFPRGLTIIPQAEGDLGHRIDHIFAVRPPGPVVIIGTDIPAITASDIADAFRALGHNDAVFGPSSDGGYWLVGLNRRPRIRKIAANVRWSSAHALADTAANLKNSQNAMLRDLDDIDSAADLATQMHLVGRRIQPRSCANK